MYIKSGRLAIFVMTNELSVCVWEECLFGRRDGYMSVHQRSTSGLSLLRMLYTLHVLFIFDFV